MSNFPIQSIIYKGETHLYNYAWQTDCGIAVPSRGKHLVSINDVEDMGEITCEKCLETIK